jgi:hypothetical protein
VPVVFTSRSEPVSFQAAAPSGEGFTAPGQHLWAAREGRLRLLTPAGTVRELTWGKPLSDGGTLIDVMSPSVSLDGKRVLFAGRKAAPDAGHFRLYEIGVDGSGLRQLTGGPDDPGCTALPPLRWRADHSLIPDDERRTTDYDDVDPVELNYTDHRIAFVSSRTPDLGRGHSRRSTTLWVRHADGRFEQMTGNRNNDRWPFLLSSSYLAFSLWSRNQEVVPADLGDLRPYDGSAGATKPIDAWLGALVQIPGGLFGMLVKPNIPLWRPRPLFVNRIAFMTTLGGAGASGDAPPLTVVQALPGMITSSPSAAAPGHPLPKPEGTFLRRGPDRDADGRPLRLATPSPCPPNHILLAGAPVAEGAAGPDPGAYGLYLARDDWPEGTAPADASVIGLQLLFDDPDLVDAEPVAVYERTPPMHDPKAPPTVGAPPATWSLVGGRAYHGPTGAVFSTGLDRSTTMDDLPGQRTDTGQGPVFHNPPNGAIDHLRIYAAHRDRFDDPDRPRVPGEWELLLKVPVKNGAAGTWVPTESPTVLAGYDRDGHIVRWETPARDQAGHAASFYAYAGDHYSLTRPNARHFCVGCHPGHSGLPAASHAHAEHAP